METFLETFSLYMGEWPWILAIAIASYLSFEYWRFPDLTIEGSFTSGMVFTYLAFSDFSHPVVFLIVAILLVPLLFSVLTWGLNYLNLPSLFAGLLTVLVIYTINFSLNGFTISQSGFIEGHIPYLPGISGLNEIERGFVISWVIILSVVGLLAFYGRKPLASKMYLSRRTSNAMVTSAAGMNYRALLLACMWIYNLIAFVGGIGFAVSTDASAVSFLGAIMPGLACMFVVRGFRDYASAPSRRRPRLSRWHKAVGSLLQWSDSLVFILAALLVLSGFITYARYLIMEWAHPGLLNALTAVGIFGVWLIVSVVAILIGKRPHSARNEY